MVARLSSLDPCLPAGRTIAAFSVHVVSLAVQASRMGKESLADFLLRELSLLRKGPSPKGRDCKAGSMRSTPGPAPEGSSPE